MSRLTPIEVALRTLEGKQLPPRCRIAPARAVEILQNRTRQDFGANAAKWRQWVRQNPECLKTFENAPFVSGTIISLEKSPESLCRVRLDSGDEVELPLDGNFIRNLHRKYGMYNFQQGLRVRVRVLEAGCSRIVAVDNPPFCPDDGNA